MVGVFIMVTVNSGESTRREQLVLPAGWKNTIIPPAWVFHLEKEVPDRFDFEALCAMQASNFQVLDLPVSPAEFEDKFNRQKQIILASIPGIENAAAILPGLAPPSPCGDIGTNLQEIYFPAIERGYKADFPQRRLINDYGDNLAKRVSLTPKTGHERFLQNPAEWKIFCHIADCMRGWPAFLELNPEEDLIVAGFSVTGGYDGASITAMHSKILASSGVCPCIALSGLRVWCSALSGGIYRQLGLFPLDRGLCLFVDDQELGDINYGHSSKALSFTT